MRVEGDKHAVFHHKEVRPFHLYGRRGSHFTEQAAAVDVCQVLHRGCCEWPAGFQRHAGGGAAERAAVPEGCPLAREKTRSHASPEDLCSL